MSEHKQGEGVREQFLQKLKYLLQINISNSPESFRYLFSGSGFLIRLSPHIHAQFQETVEEIFGCDLEKFDQLARHFGFKVKRSTDREGHARVTYRGRERLVEGVSGESSEEEDEFAREEEVEKIMRNKEEEGRRGSLPHIVLNRGYSEGNVVVSDSRRQLEDVSLEVKLYEQDLFATPLSRRPKLEPLADRNRAYRHNYDQCSQLIDTTIIELLGAHRSNTIPQRTDAILNRITEIYDLLAENIESVQNTGRLLKEPKLKEEASPGFKPLPEDH